MNTKIFIKDAGVKASAYLGRVSTDNAFDALKKTRVTFDKVMDRVSLCANKCIAQLTHVSGVRWRPIVMGDPFHISNLVVMNASLAYACDIENANHKQIHNRQALMSLHSLHADDPGYLQSVINLVMIGNEKVALQTWRKG